MGACMGELELLTFKEHGIALALIVPARGVTTYISYLTSIDNLFYIHIFNRKVCGASESICSAGITVILIRIICPVLHNFATALEKPFPCVFISLHIMAFSPF